MAEVVVIFVEFWGKWKVWQIDVSELNVDIGAFGYPKGVVATFR